MEGRKINALWDKAVQFHGHSCPGIAIGVVVSKIVIEEFWGNVIDDMVGIVENDACGVDAIQALLGCTFGNGKLIHKDYGKSVYTFYNRGKDKAIRISRKPDANVSPENQKKRRELNEKVRKGVTTTHEKLEYNKQRQNQIKSILERGRELFTLQEIQVLPPPKRVMMTAILCENCQEQTQVNRTREKNGKKLCIPCYESLNKKAGQP